VCAQEADPDAGAQTSLRCRAPFTISRNAANGFVTPSTASDQRRGHFNKPGAMSALVLMAAKQRTSRQVRKVPRLDSCTAANSIFNHVVGNQQTLSGNSGSRSSDDGPDGRLARDLPPEALAQCDCGLLSPSSMEGRRRFSRRGQWQRRTRRLVGGRCRYGSRGLRRD
jgi:hypothetical protein